MVKEVATLGIANKSVADATLEFFSNQVLL
jgi:hypothetical protein